MGHRTKGKRARFAVGDWGLQSRTTAFRRARFALFAASTDALVITVCAVLVGIFYHSVFYKIGGMTGFFAGLGLFMATLFVLLNVGRKEYTIISYLTFAGHIRRTFIAWNTSFLMALAFAFAIKETADVSRAAALLFYVFGLVSLVALRAVTVLKMKALAQRGRMSALRVVLVGTETELRDFTEEYQPWTVGVDVIASAVLRGADTLQDDLALAAATARVLRPDDTFILAPWTETAIIDASVAAFMNVPTAIHLGPQRVLDRFTKASVSRIGRIASLHLVGQPLTIPEIVIKRIFDVTMSAGLLLVLVPVFCAIALAIKLDSPGSVFFVQRRYGFNQETFRILKFRSMTVAEDDRTLRAARRDDPRVTRFGRFMRRYNIDELPQLLNVLRGDMSLVGPRPHALAHNHQYERTIADYARRHNVKPGITGWAAIHGLRGEIVSDEIMRLRVEYDLFYIDNWSLGLDLRILYKTLVSSKAFQNAY